MSYPLVSPHGVAGLRRLGKPLLAAGAVALFAVACAPLTRPKIDPPGVTLESVRIVRIAQGKAILSLSLRVTNPNSVDLAIDSAEVAVTLDGQPAASVHSVHIDPLPAGGEAKVELAGQIDVVAVATALMAFAALVPVEYTLAGTATLHNGAVLPFAHKGNITVARFEHALGGSP